MVRYCLCCNFLCALVNEQENGNFGFISKLSLYCFVYVYKCFKDFYSESSFDSRKQLINKTPMLGNEFVENITDRNWKA